ncbi:MAG: cell wall hydrolase [Sulfuricaulis sp.]|nr:cell wall hydrolase [Sulfuricaulis sp.]
MITGPALLCLAAVVYHEARGEPVHAQHAVAQVVLNRAGRDPERVCTEARRPWQFAWKPGHEQARGHVKRPGGRAWLQAKVVAGSAWHVADFTAGATHFHAVYVRPMWAPRMVEVGRWGGHIFYRELPRNGVVR